MTSWWVEMASAVAVGVVAGGLILVLVIEGLKRCGVIQVQAPVIVDRRRPLSVYADQGGTAAARDVVSIQRADKVTLRSTEEDRVARLAISDRIARVRETLQTLRASFWSFVPLAACGIGLLLWHVEVFLILWQTAVAHAVLVSFLVFVTWRLHVRVQRCQAELAWLEAPEDSKGPAVLGESA